MIPQGQQQAITLWLQAAQPSDDYRQVFYHMPGIGRKHQELFDEMIRSILEHLGNVLAIVSSMHLCGQDCVMGTSKNSLRRGRVVVHLDSRILCDRLFSYEQNQRTIRFIGRSFSSIPIGLN